MREGANLHLQVGDASKGKTVALQWGTIFDQISRRELVPWEVRCVQPCNNRLFRRSRFERLGVLHSDLELTCRRVKLEGSFGNSWISSQCPRTRCWRRESLSTVDGSWEISEHDKSKILNWCSLPMSSGVSFNLLCTIYKVANGTRQLTYIWIVQLHHPQVLEISSGMGHLFEPCTWNL